LSCKLGSENLRRHGRVHSSVHSRVHSTIHHITQGSIHDPNHNPRMKHALLDAANLVISQIQKRSHSRISLRRTLPGEPEPMVGASGDTRPKKRLDAQSRPTRSCTLSGTQEHALDGPSGEMRPKKRLDAQSRVGPELGRPLGSTLSDELPAE
jgi:hypothetical protein